ncbi:hypothetical protein DICVIV_09217 [Dictyocaulus viviparus]|uniref:Uncharacterized protein n=1 Tax=Dictyocaulus viviparus TaxID=29172 RepID=A0A0D8XJM9_DICVI|nr:hypothetical protein DICVIV_09217 [Dictyocaulus viviparus]
MHRRGERDEAPHFISGHWNDLYRRVIALNALVFSAGELHFSFKKVLSFERHQMEYSDCNDNLYTVFDKNVTLFSEMVFGHSRTTFFKHEHTLFMDTGQIIGVLLLTLLIRIKTSFQLAIGASYIICPTLHFFKNKMSIRFSVFCSGVLIMIIRVPIMMHCVESLPEHLRLYGFASMFIMAPVFNSWYRLYARLVLLSFFWLHTMTAVIIFISCVLHIWFAPPSIMDTLFHLRTAALNEALKGWIPKDQVINTDDLVDCVLYRGPAFSSEMNAFQYLSQFGVFMRKTIICTLLLPLGPLLIDAAYLYRKNHVIFGEFESSFFSDVLKVFGFVLVVVLHLKFGRRCTLAIAMISSIIALVTLLCTRLEIINICSKTQIPRGWRLILAALAYSLVVIFGSVITVVARLTLLEHVPTSVRSSIAVAFVFSTFVIITYREISKLAPKSYPNGTIIIALGYALLVAPFSLFIDDSSYLPINSADVRAYTYVVLFKNSITL